MIDYLALNASAGSGKTFALSARFIALILNGADISEITASDVYQKSRKRDERAYHKNLFKFARRR